MNEENKIESQAKLQYIFVMFIFGTVSIFSKNTNAPSALICLVRGIVGSLTIVLYSLIKHRHYDYNKIKRNLLNMFIACLFMILEWICFFESFYYTTVAIGTVCYYTMPIFAIILSSFMLNEKIELYRIILIFVASFGVFLVSGIKGLEFDRSNVIGIILSLFGAITYALFALLNKKMKDIDPRDSSTIELFIAFILLIPYTFLSTKNKTINLTYLNIVCLLIIGIVHTGFSFVLYFDSLHKISAQSIAVLSYIDPVISIFVSILFFKERIYPNQLFGIVLILLSSFLSEFISIKRNVHITNS